MASGRGAGDFIPSFKRLADAHDGVGLHALLRSIEAGASGKCGVPSSSSAALAGTAEPTAVDVVHAMQGGVCESGFGRLCSALRHWCARYIGEQGGAQWMLIPLLWLGARARQFAAELDRTGAGTGSQAKLVETLRELFQKLHRDRGKCDGALAISCELLRLYFRLGQVSQCSFLLAAISQSKAGQQLDPGNLPKALAVSLFFYWGKHCVLEGSVVDAEEKLGWALAHCLPRHRAQREKILTYLLPCRLRLGKLPARSLLDSCGLGRLAGIAGAAAAGDVERFNGELEAHEAELIDAGTYLMFEKLKVLAYRNLCRRVHGIQAAELERAGKGDQRHKQDLRPYERALEWQDACDAYDSISILAHLIYIGAIRGYLSDEHRKVVFSKEAPFPPVATWGPKA